MCWSHGSHSIDIEGDEQVIVDEQLLIIEHPQLWSVDTPNMYRLETELRADGALRGFI